MLEEIRKDRMVTKGLHVGQSCVKDAPRTGHLPVKIEELQIQVLGTIAIQPKQSVPLWLQANQQCLRS